MKWFKHDTDGDRSAGLSYLIDQMGCAGYGRWFRLLEIVAEKMDSTDRCHVEYSPKKWCSLLGVKQKQLVLFLELTENKLKTKITYSENIIKIEIPNLLKKRDDYSKKSGQKPDKEDTKSSLDIRDKKQERTPLKPPRKTGERVADQKIYLPHFTEFWDQIYPHREGVKTGKQETWNEFLNLAVEELPLFITAAKNFKALKAIDTLGVMDPIRFLIKGRGNKKIRPWTEYVEVKIPEHVDAGRSKDQEELLSALKNENYKKLPPLSTGAEAEFTKLSLPWPAAQQQVKEGKDIFNANTNRS